MIAVTAPKPGACGTWYPSQAPAAAQAVAVNAPTPRGAVDRNQPVCTARATGGAIETTASVCVSDRNRGKCDQGDQHAHAPAAEAEQQREQRPHWRALAFCRTSHRGGAAGRTRERRGTRRAAKPTKTPATISAILPWVFDGVKSSWLVV